MLLKTFTGGMRRDDEIARVIHQKSAIRVLKNSDGTKRLQIINGFSSAWQDATLADAHKLAGANVAGRDKKFRRFLTTHFGQNYLDAVQTVKPSEIARKQAERPRFTVASDGVKVAAEVFSGDYQKQLRLIAGRKLQLRFGHSKFQTITPAEARVYFQNDEKFSAFVQKHFPTQTNE